MRSVFSRNAVLITTSARPSRCPRRETCGCRWRSSKRARPACHATLMKALVVGGTGLVSTGIVRQLLARGVQVSVFNRGLRSSSAGNGVRLIRGDRDNAPEFVRTFEHERFDVVYDMICYTAEHAEATAHAFAGRCEQLV